MQNLDAYAAALLNRARPNPSTQVWTAVENVVLAVYEALPDQQPVLDALNALLRDELGYEDQAQLEALAKNFRRGTEDKSNRWRAERLLAHQTYMLANPLWALRWQPAQTASDKRRPSPETRKGIPLSTRDMTPWKNREEALLLLTRALDRALPAPWAASVAHAWMMRVLVALDRREALRVGVALARTALPLVPITEPRPAETLAYIEAWLQGRAPTEWARVAWNQASSAGSALATASDAADSLVTRYDLQQAVMVATAAAYLAQSIADDFGSASPAARGTVGSDVVFFGAVESVRAMRVFGIRYFRGHGEVAPLERAASEQIRTLVPRPPSVEAYLRREFSV